MARRPSIFFRFAGLLSMFLLASASLAYVYLVPKPTPRAPGERPPPTGDDAQWQSAKAWVSANPGFAVLACRWPTDLPRGGRIDGGPADAPSFWDQGSLVQAVIAPSGAGLVRAPDGEPRAWVSWTADKCDVVRPQTVRVDGQVMGPGGAGRGAVPVTGCGITATSDELGAFTAVLSGSALAVADAGPAGPQCALSAGGASTQVPLHQGGVVKVLVR